MSDHINSAISVLNDALESDPEAVYQLFCHYVPCNEELANHPTIQVRADSDGTNTRVGVLGLINGFFGTLEDGYGYITMLIDTERQKIVRFERTDNE